MCERFDMDLLLNTLEKRDNKLIGTAENCQLNDVKRRIDQIESFEFIAVSNHLTLNYIV